jgi:hypothetical protein
MVDKQLEFYDYMITQKQTEAARPFPIKNDSWPFPIDPRPNWESKDPSSYWPFPIKELTLQEAEQKIRQLEFALDCVNEKLKVIRNACL